MTTLADQITGAAEFHVATLATWWEKLFYRHRFPQTEPQSSPVERRAG